MKKLKLVMVGNGMAGVRTLEELLKLSPDMYEITVFGAEPYANYNRILLSPVLAGEQTIKEIMLNDVDWYAQNDIKLHLNKKVVKIDRAKRVVYAEDGTTAEYDRLLLALQRGDSRPLQVRRASPLLQRSPLSVWRAVALISLLFNLLLFYALLLH